MEKYRKELEKKQVEEESPETKAEVDRLIDLLDEAEEKIKERERKLGLTRKDKIRRYLIKIGVPLLIAGVLTALIELIINLTKNVAEAVDIKTNKTSITPLNPSGGTQTPITPLNPSGGAGNKTLILVGVVGAVGAVGLWYLSR